MVSSLVAVSPVSGSLVLAVIRIFVVLLPTLFIEELLSWVLPSLTGTSAKFLLPSLLSPSSSKAIVPPTSARANPTKITGPRVVFGTSVWDSTQPPPIRLSPKLTPSVQLSEVIVSVEGILNPIRRIITPITAIDPYFIVADSVFFPFKLFHPLTLTDSLLGRTPFYLVSFPSKAPYHLPIFGVF